MMSARIMEEAEGTPVLDTNGEEIGVIAEVRQGIAYIAPRPNLSPELQSKLNLEGVNDGSRSDRESIEIEAITDEEIRLCYES